MAFSRTAFGSVSQRIFSLPAIAEITHSPLTCQRQVGNFALAWVNLSHSRGAGVASDKADKEMAIHSPTTKAKPTEFDRKKRLFTIEQANRSLPYVSRVVVDIVKQHRKVGAIEDKCHIHRPSVSREEHELLCDQYRAELEKLRDLTEELAIVGCSLRDMRRGIVDFPCMYRGRLIELCWLLGQNTLLFWHEVGEGFRSRQAIDEDFTAQATGSDPIVPAFEAIG